MLGNNRLRVLPVWELKFGSVGVPGARHIATEKAKHDTNYQERIGIADGPADDLTPELSAHIQRLAKRIYRTLGLDGYARIDFRLSTSGVPSAAGAIGHHQAQASPAGVLAERTGALGRQSQAASALAWPSARSVARSRRSIMWCMSPKR